MYYRQGEWVCSDQAPCCWSISLFCFLAVWCQMVLACFKHPEQLLLSGDLVPDFIQTGKKCLLGHNSEKKKLFLLFSTRFLVRLGLSTPLNATLFRGGWSHLLGFTQNWNVFYCSCLLPGLIAGVRLCLFFRIGVFWMFLMALWLCPIMNGAWTWPVLGLSWLLFWSCDYFRYMLYIFMHMTSQLSSIPKILNSNYVNSAEPAGFIFMHLCIAVYLLISAVMFLK